MLNGATSYADSNGNSFAEDRVVRSLPWLFRVQVPGFQHGWPAR